jgi:hypothetical protein
MSIFADADLQSIEPNRYVARLAPAVHGAVSNSTSCPARSTLDAVFRTTPSALPDQIPDSTSSAKSLNQARGWPPSSEWSPVYPSGEIIVPSYPART